MEEANNNVPQESPSDKTLSSDFIRVDQLTSTENSDKPPIEEKLQNGTTKPRVFQMGDHMLWLGVSQLVIGISMVAFGILVIMWSGNLSQIGGGIWGGCIAMSAGIAGIFASNKNMYPSRTTAHEMAHVLFLVFCLLSLAASQLVAAITATGLSRDIYKSQDEVLRSQTTSHTEQPGRVPLSWSSTGLLLNVGLLICSGIACALAIISCYKNASLLCTCFRKKDFLDDLNECPRYDLINSWLVMASPGNNEKDSKLIGRLPSPVFTIPSLQPSVASYPLIPAPLGPVPSPIIPPAPRRPPMRKQWHRKYLFPPRPQDSGNSAPPARKNKNKLMTNEEVVRTYTGLDRTIAEQFIDICESRNTTSSLYGSDSNCASSCQTYSTTNDENHLIAKS